MREGEYIPKPGSTNSWIYMWLKAGYGPGEIAEAMKVTRNQVIKVRGWIKHGFRPNSKRPAMVNHGQKMRACIGINCGGKIEFLSDGPGNRLCPRCAHYANTRSGTAV